MMSKKKKDKDEPKKTKARSSKRASQDAITPVNDPMPVVATDSPGAPKPRRAITGRKKTAAPELSADDIALRAYYLAEHRRSLNLPGDELADWVEAERQLRKEAAKKSA
jgi:hypothetical protein